MGVRTAPLFVLDVLGSVTAKINRHAENEDSMVNRLGKADIGRRATDQAM